MAVKKIFSILVILSLFSLAGGQLINAQEAAEEDDLVSEEAPAVDASNRICPVSGEKIDEKTKATYEYEGKIYNFCCPMCIDEFKKDPQEYIKKVEEEKADAQASVSEPMPMHQGHTH